MTVCTWNTNGIEVWAWMHCSRYALRTRAEFRFGHGCTGHRMLLENERNYVNWAWMRCSPYAFETRSELWFGHGCTGDHMLLERARFYGLGMDALVTVFS